MPGQRGFRSFVIWLLPGHTCNHGVDIVLTTEARCDNAISKAALGPSKPKWNSKRRNMSEGKTVKWAVLIDADNAQPSIVEGLLSETAKYGTANVKRIYGDWTLPGLKGWKEVLLQYSIQPIQQFGYTSGKNTTDSVNY